VDGFRQVLERHRYRWQNAAYWLAWQEYLLGYWLHLDLHRHVLGARYLIQAAIHHPRSRGRQVFKLLWSSLRQGLARRLQRAVKNRA
jgi:hypothetical protein